MAFKFKVLIAIFVVIGFDAAGAALSKLFRFDYAVLVWGSFLIYLVLGYWGARSHGMLKGTILGALAGFVDSTLGWFISWKIGPVTKSAYPEFAPFVVLMMIVTVTTLGAVLGLRGSGCWKMFVRSKSIAS